MKLLICTDLTHGGVALTLLHQELESLLNLTLYFDSLCLMTLYGSLHIASNSASVGRMILRIHRDVVVVTFYSHFFFALVTARGV